MITSASYETTVDGQKCMDIAAAMENSTHFIKSHRISLSDFYVIQLLLNQLWKDGIAKTFIAKAAEIFAKYSFMVELCNDGINYKIQ